tara:strand:- start:54 stop:164 length:111 start_codon:yes stop_codon:yes gene_type:complete
LDIKQLKISLEKLKAWMIDWAEEYFESDDGELINPF